MERKTTLTSQTQAVHLGYPSFTTCTVSGIGKPIGHASCVIVVQTLLGLHFHVGL